MQAESTQTGIDFNRGAQKHLHPSSPTLFLAAHSGGQWWPCCSGRNLPICQLKGAVRPRAADCTASDCFCSSGITFSLQLHPNTESTHRASLLPFVQFLLLSISNNLTKSHGGPGGLKKVQHFSQNQLSWAKSCNG